MDDWGCPVGVLGAQPRKVTDAQRMLGDEMSDLEIKLAKAHKKLVYLEVGTKGFEVASRIAREVVAERDAQFEFEAAGFVRRLAEKDKQLLDMSAYTAEFNVYREQLVQMTKELAEKDAEIARRMTELRLLKNDLLTTENALAEKDDEIARLEAQMRDEVCTCCGRERKGFAREVTLGEPVLSFDFAQPRKVTDAQLEQIKMAIKIITSCQRHQAAIATNAVRQIIEESTDEPAAK
jgi:DNA repair exonuclease SbcCD ATPase subunit